MQVPLYLPLSFTCHLAASKFRAFAAPYLGLIKPSRSFRSHLELVNRVVSKTQLDAAFLFSLSLHFQSYSMPPSFLFGMHSNVALWSAYPPPDKLVRDYFLLCEQDGLPLFEAFKDAYIHSTHFVDAAGHHVVISQVYRLLLHHRTAGEPSTRSAC